MSNNHILIITSDFLPIPSANGVCAYNLSKVLIEKSNSVDVISNRKYHQKKIEILDDITIHRVPIQLVTQLIKNKKLQTIVLRFNILLHYFMYPLVSILGLLRYIHKVNKIIKQKQSTILIVINNPLVGCIAGVFAKRRFKEKLNFVLYDVDSFSNTLHGKYISLEKKRKLMWKWEKIIFQTVDLAIVMKNHEQHYSQEKYKPFEQKIKVANFPMLNTHSLKKQKLEEMEQSISIRCVYLGSLSQSYRNPQIACEVISKIQYAKLQLYGKIDNSLKVIEKLTEITDGRIQHCGMVSFLDGQSYLQNADVLISIGNRDSDMVPSKTFEYMSYCKPIIHFYVFKEDPVIHSLSQYPNVLLLDANAPIQALVEKTKDFLSASIGKIVDPKKIRELLYENTPEYSIDLIGNFLSKKNLNEDI